MERESDTRMRAWALVVVTPNLVIIIIASHHLVFINEIRVEGGSVLVLERHALGSPLNHLVRETDVDS
jgi:hypothetical protein